MTLGAFGLAIFAKGQLGYAVFATLAVVLSYLAARELCSMISKVGRESYPGLASFTCAAIVAVAMLNVSPMAMCFGVAALLLASSQGWLIILLARGRLEVLERVLNTIGVIFMLSIPFFILASIYFIGDVGKAYLIFLILVTKAGDIGAYVVGSISDRIMVNGNHKMVPSISPGKSWEGLAGGLASSVGVSFWLGNAFHISSSWAMLSALGLTLFLGGFVGDLAESSLKRICGVKDSGSLLPGIGGVLDLLDSLLLNAPLFALFLMAQTAMRSAGA